LADKNIDLTFTKLNLNGDPYIYQMELKNSKTAAVKPRSSRNRFGAPYSHLPKDKVLTQKVKLSLSGGQLMVQTGGGYKSLIEFLEHKGYFYGTQYDTSDFDVKQLNY